MERLTHKRANGIKSGYWSPAKKQELVDRLAMYENQEIGTNTNVGGKWIPVSEKVPELDTPVLAQWRKYYSDENNIDILYLNGLGEWYADLGVPNGKVIAWMPLPEPYREEE